MEKRNPVSVPLAKLAAAGVALALCPAGSLAAACADAVVMASRSRGVSAAQAKSVLLVMNTGMALFASATGLVSCGLIPAVLAGVLTAVAVGHAGMKVSERSEGPASRPERPPGEYEGEIVDAHFVDADDGVERAETRSEAVLVVDPAKIRAIVEKRARGRL